MPDLRGITYGILKRLHHFLGPDTAGNNFVTFMDILGSRLERAEKDLYEVMASRHVMTADNDGSLGYTAKDEDRGDLDKILAMYLEYLGGTSQLMQMKTGFTINSFDARKTADALVERDTPFIEYMRKIFENENGFKLLSNYNVKNALLKPGDISRAFVLEMILCQISISGYIRKKIEKKNPDTINLLYAFSGGELSENLKKALARDINVYILKDSSFFQKNYEELFKNIIQRDFKIKMLCQSNFNSFFKNEYLKEKDIDKRNMLMKELDGVEKAPSPPGDDIIRLNRMLLDKVYGANLDSWKKAEIPLLKDICEVLKTGFNKALDIPNLYEPEKFPDIAEDYDFIKERFEKKFQDSSVINRWMNRKLLESAFPVEIEKSHVPYRNRFLKLIQIIRQGASTKQGIQDIVAANLGIIEDDAGAKKAKSLIKFEEYLIEDTSFFKGSLGLYQEFESRAVSFMPPEIRIFMRETPDYEGKIADIKLIDRESGAYIRFPGAIQTGDTLTIKKDGSVFLNGVIPAEKLEINPPADSDAEISEWRLEAKLMPKPDGGIYSLARCDSEESVFNESVIGFSYPVVEMEIISYDLTPGAFRLKIPWHIPGYTDKYAENIDHPRHQILSILNKVKASGVMALVSYYQNFKEEHNVSVKLGITAQGALFNHSHKIEEDYDAYLLQEIREIDEPRDGSNSGHFDSSKFDNGYVYGYGLFFNGEFKERKEHEIETKLASIGDFYFKEKHIEIRDKGLSGCFDEAGFDKEFSFEYNGLRVSDQAALEVHNVKESLIFSGVFDYTKFGSLNEFG